MDRARLDELLRSARLDMPADARVEITGRDPVLPARFPVGETAAAALALCGVRGAVIAGMRGQPPPAVRVDVGEAAESLRSFLHVRVGAAPVVREWNPLIASYECRDGRWIHLHGAFPHLRDGTLAVLACEADAASIAAAVRSWDAQALEDALAERGMCGAMARTAGEWGAHPQAVAIGALPAVEVERAGDAPPEPFTPAARPLAGVRVLDLTRILAGPTCGRTLAMLGADVLHVTSPNLPTIDLFDIDTGHGKLSAHLDLDDERDVERLRALVSEADVFVDGFRSGALERRGFGAADVAGMRPGIVHAAINCYGHAGPWAGRPGWEQLAQTVSGIATAEGEPGPPRLIGVAACDYTTGYLAAAGVLDALARRARDGGGWLVRASLCQTAMWIERQGAVCVAAAATSGDGRRFRMQTETPFGTVTHLRPPLELSDGSVRWDRPTSPLGTHEAAWPAR